MADEPTRPIPQAGDPGSESGPHFLPHGTGDTPGYGSYPAYGSYAEEPRTSQGPYTEQAGSTFYPPHQASYYPAPPAATAVATKPARKPRTIGSVVVAATVAAVVGAGTGVGGYALSESRSSSVSAPVSVTTVPASQAPTLNGSITAAAQKIEPSVVTITVQSGSSGDIGTGVVIDSSGHILTNEHVVDAANGGGSDITVTLHNGRNAKASIVGESTTNDLAVLKLNGVSNVTPATFAKSSSLVVGQTVVAAGAPLGLSETITSGIVSSTARPVRSGTTGNAVYLAVQTDAAINPGNSGGPLVDLNGAVVGINSSIASTGSSDSSGTQSGNIGIGFAIPSDVADRVAADIITTGHSTDAKMGVTVGGTDGSQLSPSTGVTLRSVSAGSPAAVAGLRVGDVITRVNNFATTTSDGLIAVTRYYAPGTSVKITYLRGGASHTTTLTLGSS